MNINLPTLFLYSGIIGTVIFILKTALPVDTGSEISSDFTEISDTDSSFSLFTIESISAFLMCGGWMGYIAKNMNYGSKLSLAIAIVAGTVGMLFFVWLVSKFKKLEHIPTANLQELVGKSGKTYMRFLPNGVSKIQIEFNSKLEILEAKNNSDVEIDSFQPIKVVKVENNIIYIEKE